ncbi:MAG: ornithine carbamoyltransferase [Saccharolobus sp.]|uniref:Ornithine carbamoyltransferase n=1 Tax=Saccharolobus shibatae (strain ATCC 51178 / DSM 5389 / JCM 8931 / NBRC 15437 / B12) TaxID=523848 RepID=A0A8F5BQZ2_SACSH|nr:ornithine carbamoyltransferase [Saccharolobus shibatae]MCH4815013.1 ornithine carbamoyltransferase [Saccharolobus shibatae]QXJ29724.1 Ornithine carbamoyltransferase [Saccharolobus shibatae B12]
MFRGRSLLCLLDFETHEIEKMLDVSFIMKNYVYHNNVPSPLSGKRVALLFEKPSTRTRVSTELAVSMLGGIPIVLNKQDLQWSRGEPIEDTGRVLGRVVNGIGARVLNHLTLVKLKESSGVPVFNLLSDLSHPLQALADLMTIRERFGNNLIKIAFVGDGTDNVLLSLMAIVAKLGLELHIATPKELKPREDLYKIISEIADDTGSVIEIHEDPYDAVRGVHVVYTDVWVSMGQENIAEQKKKLLQNYRVTSDLMNYAVKDAIFMHCLPANRGEEVEPEVIDGPKSAVWDQAENRLYTAMAVFSLFI